MDDKIVKIIPPDYSAVRDMIFELKDKYPFIKYAVCGRSWAGRAIFSLSIGDSSSSVLYAGAFHGQEWLTELVLLNFLESLCHAIETDGKIASIDVNQALYGRELTIIPCVNPDGVQIALNGAVGAGCYAGHIQRISGSDYSDWNANARGVDINHNFDAGWDILQRLEKEAGINGPAPRRFGGTSPESEPETRALTKICREKRIQQALALHSQGEEIYWDYGEYTPSRSHMMAKILAASSGYTLSEPEEIASHGGFKDWFIKEFGRPAFTVEIGKGSNPLPIEQFDSIYNQIEEMLFLAALM